MLQWLDLHQPPIRVINPATCNNKRAKDNKTREDNRVCASCADVWCSCLSVSQKEGSGSVVI